MLHSRPKNPPLLPFVIEFIFSIIFAILRLAMRIKETFVKFLKEITSGPEDKVNELSLGVASACKKGVPIAKQLEMLRNLAKDNFSVQARYDLLCLSTREHGEHEDNIHDQITTYIVAAGDTILALLGEDPGSIKNRTEEENERIRLSCKLQRGRINWNNVGKDNLRDTLWQSFGIKALWKIIGDPRWQYCNITGLEVQAKDEWNRVHPMPKNF
jgi:hypothetical protein